ncbi:cell division protein CrgA [Brachybacterium phenoliresistens]|uniref:Cell division protein CrgA n=1 Tax=Brachybacterium phenoliresistens TaxID=396014 RepID=Z9JPK7_9MICO|nr:cell division protein CrgA [Brachybacterium phenoliresistens]EWS79948.1 hypothetical protein BF93_08425 [Brachybacterium phenoliresistens]
MAAKKRNRRTGRATAGTKAEAVVADDEKGTAATGAEEADTAVDTEDAVTADADAAADADSDAETREDAADDAEDAAAGKRGRKASDAKSAAKSSTPAAAKDPVRRAAKASPAAKDAAATASAKKSAEAERSRTTRRRVAAPTPNPQWLAPFAVTMLILGLVYLVTYYLTAGQLPLPIGDWNLAVGFGVMVIGGGALMFWK